MEREGALNARRPGGLRPAAGRSAGSPGCSGRSLPAPSGPRVPRLDDDGHAVTLDLHGARVDEAERLARAVVAEAARRGRGTLRIVHGHSTTAADGGGPLGGSRTIKTALLNGLDRGAFGSDVVSALRSEGHVLLGLAPAPRPAAGRLRLGDFR